MEQSLDYKPRDNPPPVFFIGPSNHVLESVIDCPTDCCGEAGERGERGEGERGEREEGGPAQTSFYIEVWHFAPPRQDATMARCDPHEIWE